VLEHILVITQKVGRPENEISMALESILERLHEVKSRELFQFIEESIRYVKDEEDSYTLQQLYILREALNKLSLLLGIRGTSGSGSL